MKLGHTFRDPGLLARALTHRSRAQEEGGTPDNEALEFLGDAVLGLVVTELLLARFPHWAEDDLHRTRSAFVREEALAEIGREIGLGASLRTGRGSKSQGHAHQPSVLANTFEAVLGAVYQDGGLEAARTVLVPLLGPRVDTIAAPPPQDPVTALQELTQARWKVAPVYEFEGPHRVSAVVNGERYGPAEATNRKLAKRALAQLVLDALR